MSMRDRFVSVAHLVPEVPEIIAETDKIVGDCAARDYKELGKPLEEVKAVYEVFFYQLCCDHAKYAAMPATQLWEIAQPVEIDSITIGDTTYTAKQIAVIALKRHLQAVLNWASAREAYEGAIYMSSDWDRKRKKMVRLLAVANKRFAALSPEEQNTLRNLNNYISANSKTS